LTLWGETSSKLIHIPQQTSDSDNQVKSRSNFIKAVSHTVTSGKNIYLKEHSGKKNELAKVIFIKLLYLKNKL